MGAVTKYDVRLGRGCFVLIVALMNWLDLMILRGRGRERLAVVLTDGEAVLAKIAEGLEDGSIVVAGGVYQPA